MKVANSPLFLEEIPGNSNEVRRGSTVKSTVVVKNIGNTKVDVDIWIAATDNKSDPILRWCSFSANNPLSINPKDSHQVTLSFEIPLAAIPDVYNYEILIEAAAQYPDKISRRPQQLRVLPSDRDSEFGNEPIYTVQPISNSANPLSIKAGEKLEVKVKVENRSRRVDRFYLHSELTKDWYKIRYPESSLDIPGLVKETDGLELNPGNSGEITLVIQPPKYTPSGNYYPTINLVSSNTEELVLLDVVYLKLLPDDSLNVDLNPLEQKIPLEAGHFKLELTNEGNIKREISISARDREGIFTYKLEPDVVKLFPGEKNQIALKAQPRKWWRRHFYSKDLIFPFDIELKNIAPEVVGTPPALPKKLPQGTIVWQPRPRWIIWGMIFLGLLTAAGIGYYFLQKYLENNRPTPEVTKFELAKKEYEDGKDANISLTWQINNPQEVVKVTLIRLRGNVETDRKNYIAENAANNSDLNKICKIQSQQQSASNKEKSKDSFTLSDPNQKTNQNFLQSIISYFSSFFQSNENQDFFKCQATFPNNQQPGDYTFKVEVFSRKNSGQSASSQITDSITIKPQILSKIIELASTFPFYEEINFLSPKSNSQNRSLPPSMLLNWKINNSELIEELRIIGKAPDGSINSIEQRYQFINNVIPTPLDKYCKNQKKILVCTNIPIDNARKPGDYIFTLTAISQRGQQESKQTDKIIIRQLPLPQITSFSSTQPNYQGANITSKTGNTTQSVNKTQIPGIIRLNWNITNTSKIQELRIIGLAPDGSIGSAEKRYFISNNIPGELKPFCRLTPENMSCQNVPTDAGKVGDYTFKLTVVSIPGQTTPEITKETPKILILGKPPTPLNIISFTANGQNIATKPKLICAISQGRKPNDINLSWQVHNGEDIKVELLPFGDLNKTQGSLPIALSQSPSSQTITLKVTNNAGEQKTQSVVIETVEAKPSSQTSSCGSTGTTATPQASPTPTPKPTTEKNSPLLRKLFPHPKETPTPTPSNSPTPETTPTPTPSNSPTPEATPTPSNSPTPEATPTPTPSNSPTPEATPTPSNSPTPEATPTPSTPTPEETPTPSTPTPEETPTPTPTPTPDKVSLIEAETK